MNRFELSFRMGARRPLGPWTWLAVMALALLIGCGGDETGADVNHIGGGGAGGSPPLPPGAVAWLEIYALDIWAQPLPAEATSLGVWLDGEPLALEGLPVATYPLERGGTYPVELDFPEHHHLSAEIAFDGSGSLNALTAHLTGDVDHGLVVEHVAFNGDEATHRVYLGLRHRWFSGQGRPARRGNLIELFADGENAWKRVHGDLVQADVSVMASTWWWESNFELVRDPNTHMTLSPEQRWQNTILGTLEDRPADKRVIVGQFWGQDSILSWLTSDDELNAYADAPGDGFEIMGQGNPTSGQFYFEADPYAFGDRVRAAYETRGTFDPETAIAPNVPGHYVDLTQWPISLDVEHASYHQKFMVVDDTVAYIGGMNLRRVDWDTVDHAIFDERRMLFDASYDERLAVKNKEALPDMGPRKDYLMRVQGPSAQDAADVFQQRWAFLLDQGVEYASNSTPFEVMRDIPLEPGGLQVQVTATLPEPFWEHAIAESWFNAVDNAERYIYIEDQYFRAPMLNERIYTRMQQIPDLRLVVITKPINEWTDPGCFHTYEANALFASAFPSSRYMTLQLRAFDYVETWGVDETESRFADMDVHSKMLLVDDIFMSVGSANKNNRGMVYEGELNVAVVDQAYVTAERRRIMEEMLPPGVTVADDVAGWWSQLSQAATANDIVYANWEAEGFDISLDGAPLPSEYAPRGFLYHLVFNPTEECLFESVGPDMTSAPEGASD